MSETHAGMTQLWSQLRVRFGTENQEFSSCFSSLNVPSVAKCVQWTDARQAEGSSHKLMSELTWCVLQRPVRKWHHLLVCVIVHLSILKLNWDKNLKTMGIQKQWDEPWNSWSCVVSPQFFPQQWDRCAVNPKFYFYYCCDLWLWMYMMEQLDENKGGIKRHCGQRG